MTLPSKTGRSREKPKLCHQENKFSLLTHPKTSSRFPGRSVQKRSSKRNAISRKVGAFRLSRSEILSVERVDDDPRCHPSALILDNMMLSPCHIYHYAERWEKFGECNFLSGYFLLSQREIVLNRTIEAFIKTDLRLVVEHRPSRGDISQTFSHIADPCFFKNGLDTRIENLIDRCH